MTLLTKIKVAIGALIAIYLFGQALPALIMLCK